MYWFPQNSAVRMMAHRMTVLSSRRRNVFSLDVGGGEASGMGILLVAQTCADAPRAFNPRMAGGNLLQFAGHLGDRNRLRAIAAGGNHDAENFFVYQLDAHRAEPGGEQAIRG